MSNFLRSMNYSMIGSPFLHYLPEFAQTHLHWAHNTIQSSHPLSALLLLPSSLLLLLTFSQHETFPVSWFFASGNQSIGASASASILPMNIWCWFPLGLTGLISLLPNGLSRVFPSTTVWKRQFFSIQPSLWSNTHNVHDHWKIHSFD